MDVADKLGKLEVKRRALTALGLALTFGYFGVVIWLTASGEDRFKELKPNEIGDFMAGTFAPVAFLWLVIGYFLQAIELKQNSESLMQQAAEMKSAVEQASVQAKAASANEGYARLSLVSSTRTRYEEMLGKLAGKIYGPHVDRVSRETAIGYEVVAADATLPYWQRFSAGDKEVFVELVWSEFGTRNGVMACQSRIGVPEFERLTSSYLNAFQEFMRTLGDLGQSALIAEYQEETAYGHLATAIELRDKCEYEDDALEADF